MAWMGLGCSLAGAAIITVYTIANYILRRKGTAAVWWGGWVLGATGMVLTGSGWGLLAIAGPHYRIPVLRLVGLTLSAIAGLLYFAGAVHVGRLRARKTFTLHLNTTGIYRFVRHPQALGLCVLAIGVGLVSLSRPYLWAMPVLAGYWVAYTYFEERFELLPAYGDQYRTYMRSTGRLLPSLRLLFQFVSRRPELISWRRFLDPQP